MTNVTETVRNMGGRHTQGATLLVEDVSIVPEIKVHAVTLHDRFLGVVTRADGKDEFRTMTTLAADQGEIVYGSLMEAVVALVNEAYPLAMGLSR